MKKFKVFISCNNTETVIDANANGLQAAVDSASKKFKMKNRGKDTNDFKVTSVEQIVDDMDV